MEMIHTVAGIVGRGGLTGTHAAILWAIAYRRDCGLDTPVRALEELSGLGRRAIFQAIAFMECRGLLIVTRLKHEDGGTAPNEYELDADWRP